MNHQNNPWAANYHVPPMAAAGPLAPLSSQSRKEKFEAQVRAIASDIQATIQHHVNGLQARRDQLLEQLETIRKVYMDVFDQDLPLDTDDTLPVVTFTKPDLALHKVNMRDLGMDSR